MAKACAYFMPSALLHWWLRWIRWIYFSFRAPSSTSF